MHQQTNQVNYLSVFVTNAFNAWYNVILKKKNSFYHIDVCIDMFYKSLILVSNCHTDFRVRHWFFLGYFIHCCYCFIRIEMNVSVEIRWQDKWYMMLRSVPRPVKETPDKAAGVRGELLSTRTHLTNKVNILCSDCFLPIKSIWEGFFP